MRKTLCSAIPGALLCMLVLCGSAGAQWELQWSQAEYAGFAYYFNERPIVQPTADGGILVKTGTIGFTTGRDILLLKYDAVGDLSWSFTWNGAFNGNDQAYNLVQDADGNIYVAGATQVGLTDDDALLLKLDPGGMLLWSATVTGSVLGYDRAATLVVDEDGSVYLAGWVATVDNWTGRVVVCKYTVDGELEWQLPLGNPEYWSRVMPAAMRMIDGNCRFLFGYWGNSVNRYRNMLLSPTGEILSDGNGQCALGSGAASYALDAEGNGYMGGQGACRFTVYKCAPNGSFQWAFLEPTNLPSNTFGDEVTRIVVGDDGHVYATGRHYGPDYGGPTYTNLDVLTVKLDGAGNVIWSNRYNNEGLNSGEIGYGLHVTSDGHVLVSGYSGGPIPSVNLDHLALLISPEGELVTNVTYDGYGGEDCAWSITGSAGEMYFTGLSIDLLGFGHTVTQCYRLSTSTGEVLGSEHSLRASPNPFTDATMLRFNRSMPRGSHLEAHDTKGVVVGRWPVEGREHFQLPAAALPGNGVYVVRLVANGSLESVLRLVHLE
jgi:hypothetical protein